MSVPVARDRHGHTLDAILPDQSKASVKKVLKGALTADNTLCIDGGRALRGFANDLNIPYRVISPKRRGRPDRGDLSPGVSVL
jgi:hypothetical protein